MIQNLVLSMMRFDILVSSPTNYLDETAFVTCSDVALTASVVGWAC